jgi:hypothetical protein
VGEISISDWEVIMDAQGRRLLGLLVQKLEDVIPGNPETYISYLDCHEELNLDKQGETWGESLQRQGLSSLANWTKEQEKPAISGIIIDRGTSMPGEGYFILFGKSTTDIDFKWWEEQVRLSKQFDWSQYL